MAISRSALAAALIVLGLGRLASAHEQQERREIVLILGVESIQLLVGYTLPAGLDAAEIRGLIDADGSGVVDRPQEELARSTLLVPRIAAGLSITVDGAPVALTLAELAWRDGPGDPGARQGFTGLALYTGTWPGPPGGAVSLSAEGGSAVRAEVQLEAGLELVDSALPIDPGPQIIGPAEVLPGIALSLRVERIASEGSGWP